MDKTAQIDECILRFATVRWKKVAMVAADVMFETDPDMSEVSDVEVAERVKVLVDQGQLLAQGDLGNMRYSEIRLPESA